MPRKGRLSKADRERGGGEVFRGARRAHAAVESAINNLGHRGLDRVRGHGKEGFARTVALAVPAANVHRPGRMLRERDRWTCTPGYNSKVDVATKYSSPARQIDGSGLKPGRMGLRIMADASDVRVHEVRARLQARSESASFGSSGAGRLHSVRTSTN